MLIAIHVASREEGLQMRSFPVHKRRSQSPNVRDRATRIARFFTSNPLVPEADFHRDVLTHDYAARINTEMITKLLT
jgi:hypothetical protein